MAYLKKNFRKAAMILYRHRRYAFAAFLAMALFAVLGFAFPDAFHDEQQKIFKDLVELTSGKGFFELAVIIILNNLRSALIGIILGIFFGVVPFLAVAVNGYFLGAVLNKAWSVKGLETLLLILPHGVFEIPALAIAFGLGLRFGLWFREKRKWRDVKRNFGDFMLVYFCIIVPLVVVAGIIESALIHIL